MADQARTNTSANRTRTYPPGYGIVEPVANYRPWDVDAEFRRVYDRVHEHTMVDVFRLWILWTLAGKARAGAVIEIGSWRGGSGAVIATAIARRFQSGHTGDPGPGDAGERPRVILADTYAGVVKAGARDTYYKGGEHANTSPDLVRGFLDSLNLDWVDLLVGTFPEDTAAEIPDLRFSLCHIDVDVYQSARDAFEWLWPKVLPGGIVVFDDYGFYGCEGVTAYVGEVMDGIDDGVVVPNLSGQAVVVKA